MTLFDAVVKDPDMAEAEIFLLSAIIPEGDTKILGTVAAGYRAPEDWFLLWRSTLGTLRESTPRETFEVIISTLFMAVFLEAREESQDFLNPHLVVHVGDEEDD